MPEIKVIPNGDNCWPDLLEVEAKHQLLDAMGNNVSKISIAILKGGMQGGSDSLTLRIDLSDGYTLITETSVKSFTFAANVIAAYSPEDAKRGAEMFLEALENQGVAHNG